MPTFWSCSATASASVENGVWVKVLNGTVVPRSKFPFFRNSLALSVENVCEARPERSE